MSELDDHIKRVNGKVQLLLKQYQQLQKENAQLSAEISSLKELHESDRHEITRLEQQVGILKSAAGQLSEPEKKAFEKNINQYIREIDKCIGLLSE